jgi:pilus assembly protein TadC
LACAVLIGLPGGLLPGLLIGTLGPALLRRLEPASVRRERQRLVADLPLTLDLLAACLAGGSSLTAAAGAVSAAVAGPCGDRLSAVTHAVAVGTPAGEAWLALSAGDTDDPLAACARVLSRAADGGAPIAAAVGRLAVEARADARAAGLQAAHRVGVLVVAPLGLCFLPAFVLLGVVPVVVALAGPLLASL